MSTLPMYKHQGAMPVLPLPTVEETMRRYLEAVGPLVAPDQFSAARENARLFLASEDAQVLQAHLEKQQKDTPNWLSRYWSDSYLTDRNPPGTHVSPVLGFDNKLVGAKLNKDPLLIGAHIVVEAMRFHIQIEAGAVKPNQVRGKLLCMEDFNMCMGTTRIPCLGRDNVVKMSAPRGTHAHAVVMCRGRVFNLPVCSPMWQISIVEARRALADIREQAERMPPAQYGCLTYLLRDDWATVRGKMMGSAVNRFALNQIETSLFVLSLDDVMPGSDSNTTLHALMHGHTLAQIEGRSWDHMNRWWDKGLHLHVAADGRAGLTFEHSAQDSLPILTLSATVARTAPDAAKEYAANANAPSSSHASLATPVVFDEKQTGLLLAVRRGTERLQETLARLSFSVGTPKLNSKHFKALKLSPDAAVQAALQVAFRSVRGFTPSPYESASTKTYLHGRTETLRPLTPAMGDLVDALMRADSHVLAARPHDETPVPDSELLSKLLAASKAHARMARLAASGQGCDRHMFGLLCAAEELGRPLPRLFTDEAFKTFVTITLSTTHPFWQPGTRLLGFGPVISPVCMGGAYFVTPVDVTLGVSTWKEDESDESSKHLLKATVRALQRLSLVVSKVPMPKDADAGDKPKAKL